MRSLTILTVLLAVVSPALGQTPLLTVTEPAAVYFGQTVAAAGDIDNDGVPDLLVAAPADGVPGTARVVSGQSGATLYSFSGTSFSHPQASFHNGTSLSAAGDVNNDGFPDVVVAGKIDPVRVLSGFDGSALFSQRSPNTWFSFGFSVAGGADLNADGVPDVVIGDTEGSADIGRVQAYSGSGTLLHDIDPTLVNPYPVGISFGFAVAVLPDVNGDGFDDFAAGGPQNANTVIAYSGKDASVLWQAFGPEPGFCCGGFGASLDAVGDIDADGVDDLVVGATELFSPFSQQAGYVRVLSGQTGATLLHVPGALSDKSFGLAVAGLGDLDLDGVPDLAVGAPRTDTSVAEGGRVHLFSGSTGAPLGSFENVAGRSWFGWSVAEVGDVNGDSLPDLAVGASNQGANGAVTVFSFCPGAATTYGVGCAGTGGFVPTLGLEGCVQAGGGVALSIGDGLGGSVALLLLGTAQGQTPVGGGCDLLVTPLFPVVPVLPLTGAGPGNGEATIPFSLPPTLPPGTVTLQAWVIDPATAPGAAGSNGLEVTIG